MLHYFHEKRRQHRMWILLIGLMLLLFLTALVALSFGMSKTGLLVLFPLFVLFMVLIDLWIEHY